MQRANDLRHRLEHAEEVTDVLAVCWDGFEFIQQAAGLYAVPETTLYYAFLSAMTAACLGRDVVEFAPSIPADPASTTTRPRLDEIASGDVADVISALASAMHGKLTAASRQGQAADRRALLAAAESAAEIRDLLRGP